jgi:hypothetical protein
MGERAYADRGVENIGCWSGTLDSTVRKGAILSRSISLRDRSQLGLHQTVAALWLASERFVASVLMFRK